MKGFKQNFDRFLRNKNPDKEFKTQGYHMSPDTQEKVLNLQESKKNLLDTLHTLLAKADAGDEIFFSENGKSIQVDENGMYMLGKRGVRGNEITQGDIMVAGINGMEIKLDADIDSTIKKEYIVRETKRRLMRLYNQQLLHAELENTNIRSQDLCIDSYKEIAKTKEEKAYESKQLGILAEPMIESYLTKTFVDNPQLPFTLEMADVHEDVRSKMDFKLHIKEEYTRGLSVRGHRDTGIQFTMNTEKTEFKKEQVEKSKQYMKRLDKKPVDDLILVSFPIDEIQKSLSDWKADGKNKSIAGPAEKWSFETKKLVFTKMLEKLPTSLNINPEELWNSIQK